VVIALAIGIGGDVSATESLTAWRETFLVAEQSLRDGATVDLAALRPYPLYPYLRYEELTRRLPELPAVEVREFLRDHADSPLAVRLRDAWLRQLAADRRWDDYLQDFTPTRNAELDCWQRQALLETGQGDAALRDFAALWLRGVSLPNACDPIIAAWRARGEPLPERLWQRFALAMNGNNPRLAQALRPAMPATDQTLADAWLSIAGNPALILDAGRFDPNDPRAASILSDGLERWGQRNALDAAAALADSVRRKGQTPLVVLLTDGKANIDRAGAPGRARAFDDALLAARGLGGAGYAALAIDSSTVASGADTPTRKIADAMKARYLRLPFVDAARLSQAVRAAAIGA